MLQLKLSLQLLMQLNFEILVHINIWSTTKHLYITNVQCLDVQWIYIQLTDINVILVEDVLGNSIRKSGEMLNDLLFGFLLDRQSCWLCILAGWNLISDLLALLLGLLSLILIWPTLGSLSFWTREWNSDWC